MQNKIFLTMAVIFMPVSSYALMHNPFESIYIQDNGSMISFDKAISGRQGTIEPIAGTSNYDIKFQGKKYRVNINSKSEIMNAIISIFPEKIKVNLRFVASIPNAEVYFDNSFINETTDKNGNSDITGLYPAPGVHEIELRSESTVQAKSELQIDAAASVQCEGKKNMKCKIIN